MDLLLLALLTLIVMYITMRSPIFGVGGSLSVAALATLGGAQLVVWLPPVAGGLLMGLMAGARVSPAVTVVGSGCPVGLLLAWLYLRDGQQARRDLAEAFEALPAGVRLSEAGLTPEQLVDFTLDLIPGFTIVTMVAALGLAYIAAGRLFPRLGVRLLAPAPLARWRLPFGTVWTLAFALSCFIVGRSLGARLVATIGITLSLLHAAAFFMLGVAVIHHALAARRVAGPLQLLLVVLAIPVLIVVFIVDFAVAGVGLLDMWLDFRKLDKPGVGAGDH